MIAERLTASWTTTPHFTVTVAVDVTALLALRRGAQGGRGAALTVTDFVLAATAQTLAEFPDVNARTDGVVGLTHAGGSTWAWPSSVPGRPGGARDPRRGPADLAELHERAAALATAAREGTSRSTR